jgi:hypothetical protein
MVGVRPQRQKPNTILSQKIEVFRRDMRSSVYHRRLSPSARIALMALIASLAELLDEPHNGSSFIEPLF